MSLWRHGRSSSSPRLRAASPPSSPRAIPNRRSIGAGSVRSRPKVVSTASLLVDSGLEHPAGRDLRQQLVGIALLVQRLVEEILRISEVELVGERASGAVRGDLVVLDSLCRRDQRRILDDRITDCGDNLLALVDQPAHPLALLGLRTADLGANVFETANVVARLLQVLLERTSELVVRRCPYQLRQRRHELRLSAVEVGDLLLEQVLQCLQLHEAPPLSLERYLTPVHVLAPGRDTTPGRPTRAQGAKTPPRPRVQFPPSGASILPSGDPRQAKDVDPPALPNLRTHTLRSCSGWLPSRSRSRPRRSTTRFSRFPRKFAPRSSVPASTAPSAR